MEFFPKYIDNNALEKTIEKTIISKNKLHYDDTGKLIKNNRAIHNDVVLLQKSEDPQFEYNVVGVKLRTKNHIVGILHLNSTQKYGFTKKGIPIFKFSPLSNKYPTFMVPSKIKEKKAIYCVITINKWEINNKIPIGQLETIIGPIGIKQNETTAILYKNNLFPKKQKVIELKRDISLKCEEYDYETFSIDPEGCRDIDDALHIKKLNDSVIEIGVHIANVVSRIDIEKMDFNFFSSIYLENDQINMLSDKITYNDSSLGNGEIKSAVSLILKYSLSDSPKIINTKFEVCMVKNTALNYKQVDNIIKHNNALDLNTNRINLLYSLAKKLITPTNNSEFISSTKIVEYFMLLYNNMVAETLYENYSKHTILRRHKLSDTETTGCTVNQTLCEFVNRKKQNAAEYISGETTEFIEHQSLRFNLYTHATSPIRRYIDIINQKNIVNYINNAKKIENKAPFFKISPDKLHLVNEFNKNLRKFYNNYKKLKLIFNNDLENLSKHHDIPDTQTLSTTLTDVNYTAFVTEIKEYKIKVYIPELDIEHFVRTISPKINIEKQLGEIDINSTNNTYLDITIMNIKIRKFDKVTVKVTLLPYETLFNNKIYITLVDPCLDII